MATVFTAFRRQLVLDASSISMPNVIIAEYRAQGFVLTLRQLYYQFVARGYIPNTPQSYKRLGSIINDVRLAGYVDWEDNVAREAEERDRLEDYAAMERRKGS